ncbi:MAG: hypothetical protein AAF604_03360 [Acidobacteriota bacterium]
MAVTSEVDEEREFGFWDLVESVRQELGYSESQEDIRGAVLDLLGSLLEENAVVIGEMYVEGFRLWTGPLDRQVERVDFTWRRLRDWPTLYQVCWLLHPDDDLPFEAGTETVFQWDD